ncbi:MAG: hypothetical protein ACK4VW_08410 [Anaerolineales bacterium]
MSQSLDLEKLYYKQALLLAEMAAWLHDMDSCPDGKPPNCLNQLAQEVKDARRCFA